VGTRIPETVPIRPTEEYASAVGILSGGRSVDVSSSLRRGWSYENSAVVRGIDKGEVHQRIPVPISMWKPFGADGARMHLIGTAVVPIRDERAAILICYEQLLIWPVVNSLFDGPTVLLALANQHWATGTLVPQHQLLALTAWSHLFGTPYLAAVND